MNLEIQPGMKAEVLEPHEDYTGSWLLPGEVLYVIEVRIHSDLTTDARARVRCPASGVDCWVPTHLLAADAKGHRLDLIEARLDEVERLIGSLGDGAWT
jgi:hypothetical protein